MTNLYDPILRSAPRAAFKLNSAGTGYDDVSGNGNTLAGTFTFVSPILNGNTKALTVNSASAVYTPTTVFKRGMEQLPFSLEAWVLPITTGVVSILSHNARYDGLSFDGDAIRFRIDFSTLGTVEVKWPTPDFMEVYHVEGIYSPQKIQLYINRIMVAELELTPAQIADGFLQEPSVNLYCGQSASGTEKLIVDGLVITGRTLTRDEVAQRFFAGRNVPAAQDIVNQNGGSLYNGVVRDIALQRTWKEISDWQDGISVDISSAAGVLQPNYDPITGLSIAGTWNGSAGLGAIPLTGISGVKASWNGDGVYTVASSLDATTYTNLVNGQLIPSTTIDPTAKMLDLRITFAGGLAIDPAEVRDLTITVYSTNKVYGSDVSRDLLLTGAVSTAIDPHEPIERNQSAGISFYGGSATLKTDITDTPRNIASLEFWIKPTSFPAANTYLFDARAGYAGYITISPAGLLSYVGHLAVYVNGVLAVTATKSLTLGEWTHITYVPTTPFNSDVLIGNATLIGQIGLLAVYPVGLTATQALAAYNSYSRPPLAQGIDLTGPTIFETGTSYTSYVHDWSITGAGG